MNPYQGAQKSYGHHGAVGPSEPEGVIGDVRTQASIIDRQLDELMEMTSSLISELEPVLAPCGPQNATIAGQESTPRAAMCQLAEVLRSHSDRLSMIASMLRSTRQKLSV